MVIDVLTLILQQCQFEPGFDKYIKLNGLYKRLRSSLSIRSSLGDRGKEILEGEGDGEGRKVNGTPKGNRSKIRPVPCERNPRRRHNHTPAGNVFEVAPRSLFRTPNGRNELPEIRFEFNFNLIGKSTMAFFGKAIKSWRVLKSWYTGRVPGQGFRHCFADRLNQRFDFVCGTGYVNLALKPGFHMIVPIAPVVPKNFETIRTTGTIGSFHVTSRSPQRQEPRGRQRCLWVRQ